ncbi:hypothetical protein C483_17388 [Natrialba hulunbeirensis JCM 10989]|uniref:Uncharacterized protein n=2 Tax=Natrialba hulunbeirensis TaxID=123783 RepID=L9ZME6_9EURY|nr:hypothetical protein C483_17388 [Natrialba hulunbeirensis JCM 10989]
MKIILFVMLKSKALLVVDVRQLALIYETSKEAMEDEEVHHSRRQTASRLNEECAELLGRNDTK